MPLPPSTHADSSVHELLLLVLGGGVRREDAHGAGPRRPTLHRHHLLRRPQPRRARVRRARRPWWRRRGARPPPLICGLWGTQLHAAAHSSESRSATASFLRTTMYDSAGKKSNEKKPRGEAIGICGGVRVFTRKRD